MKPARDVISIVKELQAIKVEPCEEGCLHPKCRLYRHFPAIAQALLIAIDRLDTATEIGMTTLEAKRTLDKISNLPL